MRGVAAPRIRSFIDFGWRRRSDRFAGMRTPTLSLEQFLRTPLPLPACCRKVSLQANSRTDPRNRKRPQRAWDLSEVLESCPLLVRGLEGFGCFSSDVGSNVAAIL